MEGVTLHLGDCRTVLPTLPGGYVDAVVTDPPYDLKFMGCGWDDSVAFRPAVWSECLRAVKPGAYLLAFGGTRTHHRLWCAVEDAGWVLTDTLCWLHGQGFPKGKGCLKPAWEPILLARKPAPRVAPLNIEDSRIGTGSTLRSGNEGPEWSGKFQGGVKLNGSVTGRWPANAALSHTPECVCRGTKRVRSGNSISPSDSRGVTWQRRQEQAGPHYADADGMETIDDWDCSPSCPVRMLDEQSGVSLSSGGINTGKETRKVYGGRWDSLSVNAGGYGDRGGASRFFYCPKADRTDRGKGNDHPTVKPTALMSWLVSLITRPGETVLDPFAGSGSTGVAALRAERQFVGIEKDPHYHAIAVRRLADVDGPLFAAPPPVQGVLIS